MVHFTRIQSTAVHFAHLGFSSNGCILNAFYRSSRVAFTKSPERILLHAQTEELNELAVIESVGNATALRHAFGKLVVLLCCCIPAQAPLRGIALNSEGVA